MAPIPTLQSLATACKRFGPGRLPRADQRELGAGYAGAAAAVSIAVVYALATTVVYLLGVTHDFVHPFWSASALVAVPFVVPAAFLVAAAVWRYLPDRTPFFGAVAGALATVLTYAFALVLVFLTLLVVLAVGGTGTGIETTTELLEVASMLTVVIGIFAVILTGWLTIPIGCLSGTIYERARAVPVR
ncbi:hypothetical protein [Natrialba swarupiae]|uniref:Uncharacterized protein n=1 Tax=Natrialba swarupiae TaxID=2448032 RepID=A0A5D5AT07_9EURY|nr:hypothetical protein [Natrialba swarupiae]TYT62151.1 hypothetical protein FYC77_09330 [Natrialba swarupiae]